MMTSHFLYIRVLFSLKFFLFVGCLLSIFTFLAISLLLHSFKTVLQNNQIIVNPFAETKRPLLKQELFTRC